MHALAFYYFCLSLKDEDVHLKMHHNDIFYKKNYELLYMFISPSTRRDYV